MGESCAKVCFSLPECTHWVWGTEEGEQKCWFRTGDSGREAGEGWTSGAKSCVPPGTQVMVMGNSECWAEGFGYPECCDAKYGPTATLSVGMGFTTTTAVVSPRKSSEIAEDFVRCAGHPFAVPLQAVKGVVIATTWRERLRQTV